MFDPIVIPVPEKEVVSGRKGETIKGKPDHGMLNTVQKYQFKITFTKLGVPMNPVEQFLYGLHVHQAWFR